MFKCCKLIPVLIGGILIQSKENDHTFFVSRRKTMCQTLTKITLGKVFNRYDVAAALCMSIGLIFFTLADSKVQPDFNLYGTSFSHDLVFVLTDLFE